MGTWQWRVISRHTQKGAAQMGIHGKSCKRGQARSDLSKKALEFRHPTMRFLYDHRWSYGLHPIVPHLPNTTVYTRKGKNVKERKGQISIHFLERVSASSRSFLSPIFLPL